MKFLPHIHRIILILGISLVSLSYGAKLDTVSLRFSSEVPLSNFPSVSIGNDIDIFVSCETPIDISGGDGTDWTVECYLDVDADVALSLSLDLVYDQETGNDVIVVSHGNPIGWEENTQDTSTEKENEEIQDISSDEQNGSTKDEQDTVEIDEIYSGAISDDNWLSPEVREKSISETIEALYYDELVCSVEGVPICNRKGDQTFMQFHRHLGCTQIVTPETDCIGAQCQRQALRQEVAGVAVELGRHRVVNPAAYTQHFGDVSYTENSWVIGVVETGLRQGFISPVNTLFRPQDSITRAEAFGMLLESVCLDVPDIHQDWHRSVFEIAYANDITNRDYTSFEPNTPILRQEVFVIASHLLDHLDATGGCYERLVCK